MRLSFADGLFWTSVACCAFAQLSILRSVSAARGEPRVVEGGRALPRRRGVAEVLWAAAPAVALAALLVFTWRAMHPLSDAGAAAPVERAP